MVISLNNRIVMRPLDEVSKAFQATNVIEGLGLQVYNYDGFNLYYVRDEEPVKHLIQIGFRHVLHQELIHYAGYSAHLHIDAIQDMLFPLVKKYLKANVEKSYPGNTVSFTAVMSDFEESWELLRPFMAIDLLNNPAGVVALAESVRQVVMEYLEPFWHQYSDLRYINDQIIDKVPQM